MKKLYRKGTIHPSTPPQISNHLSFLPPTILSLTKPLSFSDKQVLAYLISTTTKTTPQENHPNPPLFNCNCFSCYMSYWVKWDSSPNRQLIHEIIEAFEDGLVKNKKDRSKKERKKRAGLGRVTRVDDVGLGKEEVNEVDLVRDGDVSGGDGEGEEEMEKGSVGKFVSFLGERFWGVWSESK